LPHNNSSPILTIGSFAGHQGLPFLTIYSPSKAFTHVFSRALSREVHATNTDIEVLGILVAQVVSAGNPRDTKGGWVLNAERCASGILDRVGCGWEIVPAHWRHGLLGSMMDLLPEGLQRAIREWVMKGRSGEEEREIRKEL
jgi:17beta-estradiol 17-dehydrogenase / very-long-chain 3-oxoacyl-CoA reductase